MWPFRRPGFVAASVGGGAGVNSVAIPHSRFKVELARILQEQGYIDTYATEPGDVGEVLRVTLKYTEDRDPAGPLEAFPPQRR